MTQEIKEIHNVSSEVLHMHINVNVNKIKYDERSIKLN